MNLNADPKSPLRLGILFSETGVTAVVERSQRQAIELALAEINDSGGLWGQPVEGVFRDPGSDPKRYQHLAKEMVESEGIRILFGCYMSSSRKALLPVVERAQGILFYPTLYEGFEYSDSCYYGGAAPNQNSVGLVRHLMQTVADRFYLVGSNYVFPYESNRIMRDMINANGGVVVEERYIPLHPSAAEIAAIIDDIRRHAPAAVLCTIVGDGTADFYRAYAAAGFDRETMPIGSLTTGEPELQAIGAEAAEGHLTSAPYFQAIRSVANQRFVRAFAHRFGPQTPISACAEAAYFQMHLFAEAGRKLGPEADIAALKATLAGSELSAPQGRVRLDGPTHHTHLWPRIARVNNAGQFTLIQEAAASVAPDPYLIVPEPGAWQDRLASIR